ncbi:hypothetical protein CARUB_v10019175mg [Capsella rubella]|uniref:F-box/LRR-repeat protein 15/At3g58940/PEG3-like LRR domain-containing protein n=1 Tax=Capsella rubella TaxID=81985 RepID=R0FSI9_9BRAS|nr:hypothetical protein CARUB_v10019175mg [Capsella rubella]
MAFSKNVYKALLSHKAPLLQSLRLNIYSHMCTTKEVRILTDMASARNLRKHLRFMICVLNVEIGEPLRFLACLNNCETLETLELKHSVCKDAPSSFCLKSLRTLRLDSVEFKDNESVLNLLSSCPNLEDLVVRRHYSSSRVKTFTIAVPSLQRLSIHNYADISCGDYVINAPSLKYLKMKGFKAHEIGSFLIENSPELVEANIIIYHANILGSLGSLRRLSLETSAFESTFPTGSMFNELVYLELSTFTVDWWNLLTRMLDTSPNLRVLKLICTQQWHQYLCGLELQEE